MSRSPAGAGEKFSALSCVVCHVRVRCIFLYCMFSVLSRSYFGLYISMLHSNGVSCFFFLFFCCFRDIPSRVPARRKGGRVCYVKEAVAGACMGSEGMSRLGSGNLRESLVARNPLLDACNQNLCARGRWE